MAHAAALEIENTATQKHEVSKNISTTVNDIYYVA